MRVGKSEAEVASGRRGGGKGSGERASRPTPGDEGRGLLPAPCSPFPLSPLTGT